MFEARNTSNRHPGPKIGIGDKEIQIYSWIVYSGFCQMINLCGIGTNIINIMCFVKQGFKDPVTISFLGLSLSDCGSLITLAPSLILIPCAVSSVDLPFESLDVNYMVATTPHFAFTRISSCITAMITFERCLSILVPLKIKDIVTPDRTTVIIITIFVACLFSVAPMYVANKLTTYFSHRRNKTTYGIVYIDLWKNIAKITVLVNNFIVPFGAFVIIGICTIILSAQLRVKSEWRKTNVTGEQAERVSSRNQKVAKMVVLISVLYIVCFIPASILMLAIAFEPALYMNGKYINITIASTGIAYVLECINSSVNIFIYHHLSSKYRDTFRKLFSMKSK